MLCAGRLPKSGKDITVSGSITYNGDEVSSGKFEVGSLVSYVEQLDNNEPLLTVRETLEFAGICIGYVPPPEVSRDCMVKSGDRAPDLCLVITDGEQQAVQGLG